MKTEEIEKIIRQALEEKTDKIISSRNAEVDRVAYYLEQIDNREEMLLAIPLMFKKIMAYADHSVTIEEFKQALYNSFDDKEANIIFSVLSRMSPDEDEEFEEEPSAEKPQSKKDKEDEKLAAKDRKASRRRDKDKKDSQSLADRRDESDADQKESYDRAIQRENQDILIRETFRRYK